MSQIRTPEEVLYAFSQWLQQWAGYALSQAQLYAAPTAPGDTVGGKNTNGDLSASQENQPPSHWLALFEEYGLELPQVGVAPCDVQLSTQMPSSAPHPLQDWMAEFQHSLAQFVQQPNPILPESLPVESQVAAPTPAQLVRDNKKLPADSAPASQSQDSTVADSSLPQDHGKTSQETTPVHRVKGDPAHVPARSPQYKEWETKRTPVHLRLNSKPQVPVPVPSPLPDVGESASPVPIQPSQAGSHPVPHLHIGVPAPAGKPVPAHPEPISELVSEFHQADPAPPETPFSDSEYALPQVKSTEVDFLPESDLASVLSLVKRMEDASISNSIIQKLREQSSPEGSQSTATHWPELPEGSPPIQRPSNVLADPAHRKRINREQIGRSWNA